MKASPQSGDTPIDHGDNRAPRPPFLDRSGNERAMDDPNTFPNGTCTGGHGCPNVVDMGGYELGLDVSGGDAGTLDLSAITIDDQRQDYVFYGPGTYHGASMVTGQLSNAHATESVLVTGPGYLATFTFVPSADASGVFNVAVRSSQFAFLLDGDGVQIVADQGSPEVIGVGIECVTDQHCDDGVFCTATDQCDGNGTCVGAGSPCTPPATRCCESTDTCIKPTYRCPY